jgi:hypothetical protein
MSEESVDKLVLKGPRGLGDANLGSAVTLVGSEAYFLADELVNLLVSKGIFTQEEAKRIRDSAWNRRFDFVQALNEVASG